MKDFELGQSSIGSWCPHSDSDLIGDQVSYQTSGAQLFHSYLKCLRSRLYCFVFTLLTIQYIPSQEWFSRGLSGWYFYLNSLLSVTLNISVFLTAYPTVRSSFLLYSSHLSAPLRTFTSFIHPEKSVPQAQQAFLVFGEVSNTYIHSDEVPGTDRPTPSAAFLKKPEEYKILFPCSSKNVSPHTAQNLVLACFSPDTVPSKLRSVCFPQFSFSFSTVCILHSFSIQLHPWFAMEIMINLSEFCEVTSAKNWCKWEENHSLSGSILWMSFFR